MWFFPAAGRQGDQHAVTAGRRRLRARNAARQRTDTQTRAAVADVRRDRSKRVSARNTGDSFTHSIRNLCARLLLMPFALKVAIHRLPARTVRHSNASTHASAIAWTACRPSESTFGPSMTLRVTPERRHRGLRRVPQRLRGKPTIGCHRASTGPDQWIASKRRLMGGSDA